MPEMLQHQANPVEKAKKTKELSNSTQKSLVLAILPQSKDGVPYRGSYKKISEMMGIHKSTIMWL